MHQLPHQKPNNHNKQDYIQNNLTDVKLKEFSETKKSLMEKQQKEEQHNNYPSVLLNYQSQQHLMFNLNLNQLHQKLNQQQLTQNTISSPQLMQQDKPKILKCQHQSPPHITLSETSQTVKKHYQTKLPSFKLPNKSTKLSELLSDTETTIYICQLCPHQSN